MVEKNNKDIDQSNKEAENEKNFSVWNIFEDFEWDWSLEEEIDKKQLEVNKDLFYYLWMIVSFLKYINIFLIIWLLIVYSYIYIEKNNESSELYEPVCNLLLWSNIDYQKISDISKEKFVWCPSVTLAKKLYKDALKEKTKEIYWKLIKVASDYFVMKDFINSKEVVFLLDKTDNKKDPLNLLEKFDRVKNEFLVNDKLKIQCKNLKITDSELYADCNAYSSAWDKTIPGYNWDKSSNNLKWWTSISIASSFLNFLDKQEDFILINKQKIFKINQVVWEWSYSYATPFKLQLAKRELNLK